MKAQRILMTLGLVAGLAAPVAAADLARGPGASPPALVIPAAAFATDGDHPADVVNYGYRVEAISTNQYLRAGVYLPNHSTISFVQVVARDTDSSRNLTVYLKRTKFGVESSTETLATLVTPGSYPPNGAGLVFPTVSSLGHVVDAANYAYWLELYLPKTVDAGAELWLNGVTIGYEVDDVIFADTLESGDTVMWSLTSGAARAHSAWAPAATSAWDPSPPSNQPAQRPAWMHVDDPEAEAALDAAFAGTSGYGSPYIIPGGGFKTAGYLDQSAYYISTSYGWVYCRPSVPEGTVLNAPVNLPDGAEISWFMAFYTDTRPDTLVSPNVRFWLSRFDTWTGSDEHVVYTTSSGDTAGIRSLSVGAGSMTPPDPVYEFGHHFYYATIDVGPYDFTPDYWHKVYAIVILYTMP